MSGVKFINHSGSRLLSLDLFRGWTIIGMILVNNPGSWTYMYAPLKHAKWDGWTPTDLIFPFFLWISGFAAALSLEKKSDSSRPLLYFTILRRSILLIAIGLFLSAFPFGLLASHTFSIETWRFPGVLQRIGTCYLISASLFLFGSYRLTLITSFIFLLSYTLLVEFFPVPGSGAGILSPNGSVFQYFDSLVLGSHVWSSSPAKGFDPEGIVSTLTAAVTMQSGILTYWIFKNQSRVSGIMRFTSTQILLITPGLILILAAYLLNFHCPINKNLWSISYVFLTSGTAMIAFFILHWFYDLKQFKFIKIFPDLYGKNAIFVFVLSALIARILIFTHVLQEGDKTVSFKNYLYTNYITPGIEDPYLASFLFSVLFLSGFLPLLWLFNKFKIFIKL